MSQITKQPTLFEVFGRTNTPTVPEINEEALDALTNILTSSGEDLGKVVLLRSPRAGYGKTLLLHSANSRLNETFRFLAVEPSGGGRIDGEVVLESILRQLSQVLPASGGLTEFDLFARRLLALGLKPLLISGEIPSHDREGALFAIENRPIETFDFHHQQAATAHWTQANFEVLGPRLASELSEISRCTLRGCAYWIDLLFRYATTPPEKVERSRLLTEAVFGDLQNQGSGGAEERLQSLFSLLSLVEPVVLVFDETEGLSNQPEAGLRVAAFIVQLRQACPSLTVVLSVNEDVWETGLKPLMPGGLVDRLTEYEVSLNELGRAEAEALLKSRFGRDSELVVGRMNWPAPLSARAVLREGAAAARCLTAEGLYPSEEVASATFSSGVVPPPLDDVYSPESVEEADRRLEPSTAFEPERLVADSPTEPFDSPSLVQKEMGRAAEEFEDPFAEPETGDVAEEPASQGEEAEFVGSPFEIVAERPDGSENSAVKELVGGSIGETSPPADFATTSSSGEWSAEKALKQFAASQEPAPTEEVVPVTPSAPPELPKREPSAGSPFDATPSPIEEALATIEPSQAEVAPSPFQVLKEKEQRMREEAFQREAAAKELPAEPPVSPEVSPFSVSGTVASPPAAESAPVQSPFEAAETPKQGSSPFVASEPVSPVERTAAVVSTQSPQEPASAPAVEPPAAMPPAPEALVREAPAAVQAAPPSPAAQQAESPFAAATSPFAAATSETKPALPAAEESAPANQDTSEVEELLSQFKKRFGQPGS